MFEEPYCDHSESQKECVQQESETVQFVQLKLLLIITDICWDYAFSYLTIHYVMPCKCPLKSRWLPSLEFDYIYFVWKCLRVVWSGWSLKGNCILAEAIVIVIRPLSPLPFGILLGVRLFIRHRGRLGHLVFPTSVPGPVTRLVESWIGKLQNGSWFSQLRYERLAWVHTKTSVGLAEGRKSGGFFLQKLDCQKLNSISSILLPTPHIQKQFENTRMSLKSELWPDYE